MLNTKNMRLIAASTAAGALLIAGGLTYVATTHSSSSDPLPPIVGEGLAALPSASSTDWATYGDHVVVLTVTAEREIAPSARELEVGEGLINREVDTRVDQVLWSRPGAPQLPKTLSMYTAGWRFKGDRRGEFSLSGIPRLAVGKTYFLPLTFYNEPESGLTGWGPLGPGSIFGYANGVITAATNDNTAARMYPPGEIGSTILDKPATAVLATLTRTPVDPVAIAFLTLPPTQRYNEVQRVKSGN